MLNEKTSTIEDYKKNLTAAQDAVRLHRSEVFNTRKAEFLAADGCQTCWGSHSVIVWGTLDCIRGSYDEFGVCPDCKEQQLWCGSNSNRKSGHPHVHNLPELFQTEEEKSTDEKLKQNVTNAEELLNLAEERWEIVKGSIVKVVRGRKCPVGTVGEVFWIGEVEIYSYAYHDVKKTRIGVRTVEGETYWVADVEYCELLQPRTSQDIEAYNKSLNTARLTKTLVKKGSEIVSKRVSGVVSWSGLTKRGEGPWRALVKSEGQDFWIDSTEITEINGKSL